MWIGIISDTHDEVARTKRAVDLLASNGAEALIHCGDLTCAEIVQACAQMRFYFVFGNHDADNVPELTETANDTGATCLEWGGEITLAEKRIAVTHGHLSMDLRPLLNAGPDYLLSGHSHEQADHMEGATRRINPGALFRAASYSVAMLNLVSDELTFLTVE